MFVPSVNTCKIGENSCGEKLGFYVRGVKILKFWVFRKLKQQKFKGKQENLKKNEKIKEKQENSRFLRFFLYFWQFLAFFGEL
jgi:hypothetical protein